MQVNELLELPTRLSDDDLTSEVRRLAQDHRSTAVALIAHLMEFDARRLYLAAACRSLFLYCTEILRLSEHEAYHRIEAARVARSFPAVLRLLAEGALTLTTVRLLSGRLTAENHESLLADATGKSKREVEILLARAFPSPAVPSSLRKVPMRRPTSMPTSIPHSLPTCPKAVEGDVAQANAHQQTVSPLRPLDIPTLTPSGGGDPAAASESTPILSIQPAVPSKRRHVVRPLAEDSYELRVTLSAATREKLRRATDLLRHAVPDGDAAQVIDRALTALLDDLAKKKFAATTRPRPAKGGAIRTRHVPARVKRAVWARDGGRCAFVSCGARRCPEEGGLEFHHVRPYGVGGEATVDNIELRCRAHNDYESERFYRRRYAPAIEGTRPNSVRAELGAKRCHDGLPASSSSPTAERSQTPEPG